MTAFDRLARPVQKWIRGQGWRELRDIQVRAADAILGRDADVIIAAATAGGKTEAAFLPLLSDVFDRPSDVGGFDLLYIGPLKALITDQAARLTMICDEAELPVTPWHGDIAQSSKARAIKAPRGVLLITPESLEALFVRRGAEIPRLFAATRAVVLDEMHTMLDSERGVQTRSLLTRLDLARGRRLRRIGLSATLGDLNLARAYLQPDNPNSVHLIEADGGESELRLQLKGYTTGAEGDSSAQAQVAQELFTRLRGSDNLVFAGARGQVEFYADALRHLCERQALPQEFYPHHASLSREHRSFVEIRLKNGQLPTTAVCTSTLELGIDIGDIACVAQIGAPFTVSALRQRLGRSGRRAGVPAILRQYAIEAKIEGTSDLSDRLRLRLVRAIAMIELLLENWCEPPRTSALHLSTLVHQILSIIAERGGATAARLFRVLCREGPFRVVDPQTFGAVLRALGNPDTGLIEQAADELLLLGPAGERIVEHYSFYAVFPTPEEYRLLAGGREIGTLPVDNVLAPGMLLIFSGRRWRIVEVDDRDKVISLAPAPGGTVPIFGGDPGDIHDVVIARMFTVLTGDTVPVYLDTAAVQLLEEGRREYKRLGFYRTKIVDQALGAWIVATQTGTAVTTTLALALQSQGFKVQAYDGFLELSHDEADLRSVLQKLADGEMDKIIPRDAILSFEKFHPHLTRDLLIQDALSSRLKADMLTRLCHDLLTK
ncbi:DEAD/DEAH box helicase [Loktanella sp. M215]|uniref:DEAD/DEAH box helicase n=1 Tax=Loktanella sp. M215 TaxID=2675431 RepID=UPI001EFF766C|nr:DEAD/DEAH box helicase [Loktanella sp. M215]